MRKLLLGLASLGALATTLALMLGGSAGAQPAPPQLVVSDAAGASAHILPTVSGAAALEQLRSEPGYSAPMTYHGGPVMTTATTYAILWAPPHLQNGGATVMSATYQALMRRFLADYPGHGI